MGIFLCLVLAAISSVAVNAGAHLTFGMMVFSGYMASCAMSDSRLTPLTLLQGLFQ